MLAGRGAEGHNLSEHFARVVPGVGLWARGQFGTLFRTQRR